MVGASRFRRVRRSLTRGEWLRLGAFYAVIAALHVIGWGVLLFVVVPSRYAGLGVGVGLTAYGFGLRHAFDADHISAIDNTTRKLLADGKRPLGVGFFFSLGHSTIVLALSVGLIFASRAIAGQLSNSSQLKNVGGYIGTGVSAFFLYVIAAINLVILVGIVRIFREMRQGRYDEATLEEKLNQRGFMNRILGPLARSITSSWHMYPIGLLFGLGFDTATEVGLLALAATTAAAGLPWYAILCLPILFAAGMALMDTTDGAFMNVAYGWAFSQPVRKVFYNLTITGLSVAVALIVGTVEVISIAATYFNLSGGPWDFLTGLNLNTIGFVIVGMFVVVWLAAVAIWRFGRIEQRWALAPAVAEGHAELQANAVARELIEAGRAR
jgi:high-affinity nickel-transport protein